MQNRSPITSQRRWIDLIQPALDSISIFGSLWLVCWLSYRGFDNFAVVTALIGVIVFQLVSQLFGLQQQMRESNANGELGTMIMSWFGTLLVLALLGFVTRYTAEFSRKEILAWAVLTPALMGFARMMQRLVFQAFVKRGYGARRVAIAGFNDLGRQTAMNIVQQPSLGLKLIGFFDDRIENRADAQVQVDENLIESRVSGSLVDLVEMARRGEVDTVMITLPMRAEDRIKYVLNQLSDSTVSVYIVPDFFVFELLHSRWTAVGGLPAVSVFENPLFGVDGVLKRFADILLACIALLVAAIPMMVIALLVKASSKGPVFFRQKRYGMDGQEILVWKFRSMRTCDNGPVVKQATKDDPRITRLGGVLRKTSLDELPQLFNVITGTMSLVGPRPHASAHNEQYRTQIRGYMLRHKVKPGITGLAQVNGCRGETETLDKMERRIEWDHQYIRRWSLWLDIKILFKTLYVIWGQEEAY